MHLKILVPHFFLSSMLTIAHNLTLNSFQLNLKLERIKLNFLHGDSHQRKLIRASKKAYVMRSLDVKIEAQNQSSLLGN